MPTPIIEIENLGKCYQIGSQRERYLSLRDQISASVARLIKRKRRETSHDFWALRDVAFCVNEGDVVGVIGRNGAGKSTLLKVLSQITPPTTGRVILRGRVSSLLEVGTGFHPELTGRENIHLNGSILGMSRQEIRNKFDEIVEFADIGEHLDTPVKRYSSGMYVRLAFAVAASLEPEILIIDEVLAVGDAAFQKKCLGKMGEVARGGRTVLFVSHNMAAIENLCSQTVVLKQGSVVFFGDTNDAITDYVRQTQNDSFQNDIAHRVDRSGSGKCRITGITVRDPDGRPMSSIASGGACFVDFRYKALTKLNNLALAWNVRTNLGSPLFRASTADTGDDMNRFDPDGVLRCYVPRLPLVPGAYDVTIHVTVNGVVSDYVLSAFTLIVEGGDFFGTGRINSHSPVLLDHSWNLLPVETPERDAGERPDASLN